MSALDCTRCGACCFSREADYIQVFHADEERMSDAALAFTHMLDEQRVMRFADGRCTALKLESGRFLCAIYPERPDACRWLVVDSGACHEQIAHKREEAQRLMQLRLSRTSA